MYKARSYNLVEDIFIEHAKGKVNITNAWNLIELEEDLFNPSMSCFLSVGDTTGLLDDIDFDGTETFKIKFKSGKEEDKTIAIKFRLYKQLVNASTDGSKNKIYNLYGVTPEHFTQATMDINQSFNVKLSDAVKKILGKVTKNTKREKDRLVDVHDTTGIYTYIIPGMTPYESMEFLQRRSYDSTFTSSLFTFYESNEGFNFHNVERLIKENREKDKVFEYTYSEATNVSDQLPGKDTQFAIEGLSVAPTKEVMSRIKSGSYASQVVEIDLINQTTTSNRLLVKDNFKDFYHLDEIAMSLDSKAMIDDSLNVINSTKWRNKSQEGDNKIASIIPRRRFYRDSLSTVEIQMSIPGNSNLAVGKVINVKIPKKSAKMEGGQEPKVTGKYLITRLIHSIDRNQGYGQVLMGNKESFIPNVEDRKKNIIGSKG